jgi:hypothetical protein
MARRRTCRARCCSESREAPGYSALHGEQLQRQRVPPRQHVAVATPSPVVVTCHPHLQAPNSNANRRVAAAPRAERLLHVRLCTSKHRQATFTRDRGATSTPAHGTRSCRCRAPAAGGRVYACRLPCSAEKAVTACDRAAVCTSCHGSRDVGLHQEAGPSQVNKCGNAVATQAQHTRRMMIVKIRFFPVQHSWAAEHAHLTRRRPERGPSTG